jgi:hypothetical protein
LFEAESYEPDNPFSNILEEFPQQWIFPFKSGATCSISGGNKRKRQTNKRKKQSNKRKSNKRKTNKRKSNKRKNK